MLNINQIYNEDCLSGMKKLSDGSIDFIMFQPENPWSLDRGMNGARYRIYIY